MRYGQELFDIQFGHGGNSGGVSVYWGNGRGDGVSAVFDLTLIRTTWGTQPITAVLMEQSGVVSAVVHRMARGPPLPVWLDT